MSFDSLKGKVIAVTGGASGIGLGLVRKLLQIGAKVAVADLKPTAPNELNRIATPDVHYTYTSLDVSSREPVHQWIQATVKTFGRLDAMVPNAAICPDEENYLGDDLVQKQLTVNVMGVWICATEAFMQFKQQDSAGVIVVTASSQGLRGGRNIPGYTATKHAVIGLVRAWAVDWAHQGVRVNAVAPGEITRLDFCLSEHKKADIHRHYRHTAAEGKVG